MKRYLKLGRLVIDKDEIEAVCISGDDMVIFTRDKGCEYTVLSNVTGRYDKDVVDKIMNDIYYALQRDSSSEIDISNIKKKDENV